MGLLVSLVAAMVVGGLATPRVHVVVRTIVLKAPPATVWKLIRTFKEYPNWRDDIFSVEEMVGSDPRPAWTQIGGKSLSYIATTDEAPVRFTTRILDDDLGYSSEWQHVLAPVGDGTRLTITETGEVPNPIFRFLGAHIVGYNGPIDAFLRNAALELGELAKPGPVTA